MTSDQVEKWAREAGFRVNDRGVVTINTSWDDAGEQTIELAEFAAIVRREALLEAVKLCDARAIETDNVYRVDTARECAADIVEAAGFHRWTREPIQTTTRVYDPRRAWPFGDARCGVNDAKASDSEGGEAA